MAIGITFKSSRYQTTNTQSTITGDTTWTPAVDSLLVCFVCTAYSSSPSDPTGVTGHGVSYSQLTLGTSTLSTLYKLSAWVGKAGSSPTSAAPVASITSTNNTGGLLIEFEVTGADVSGTALQAIVASSATNTGTSTTPTVTLASPGNANNRAMTFVVTVANAAPTTSGSWILTAGAAGNFASPGTGAAALFDLASFNTAGAATTTNVGFRMVGIEIKADPGTVRPIPWPAVPYKKRIYSETSQSTSALVIPPAPTVVNAVRTPLFANHKKAWRSLWPDSSQSTPTTLIPTVAGGSHPSSGSLAAGDATVAGAAALTVAGVQTTREALLANQRKTWNRINADTSQSSQLVTSLAYDLVASVSLEFLPAPFRRSILSQASRGTPAVLYAFGAVEHTTTGALAAQDATVAGSALHPHTSTGTLAADAATVSGAALHPHATTGTLAAQDATVAGTAFAPFTTSGALAAGAAAVAGTVTHLTLHATSGALAAADAAVSGSAVAPFLTSGALAAGDSSIAGTAALLTLHDTSGALAAQDATAAGTAVHLTLHTSSGSLASDAATVSGDAATGQVSSGDLVSGDAAVAGSAEHLTLHVTTGTLTAGAAAIAGAAAAPFLTSGALTAGDSTVAGAAERLALHATSGDLAAGVATVNGDAELVSAAHDATGNLSAQAAAVVGAAVRFPLHEAAGSLVAGDASVSGAAARLAFHNTTGDLLSSAATITGFAVGPSTDIPSGGGGGFRPEPKPLVFAIDDEELMLLVPVFLHVIDMQ